MNKTEFLQALRQTLVGLPQEDIEKSVDYYNEILADSMEDGMSEEEAVASLGSMEEIRLHILADIPLSKLVGERRKASRELRGWEITLLVLGFPIWLPLLFVAVSLALVAYVLVWVFVGVCYIVDFVSAVGGVAAVLAIIPLFITGNFATGVLGVGCGLVMVGLGILCFFLCNLILKGTIWGSKQCILMMKNRIVGKEAGK